VAYLFLVRTLNNNEKYTWPRRSGGRPAMQWDQRLRFLVSSLVCVRSWLGCIAHLENRFMDWVPGRHGDTMSAQRFPMRPRPLLLHWPVFHSWCCCFPWIRSWIFAVWILRMEMDLRRNSYWRYRPHLHSRTHSRSLSAKWTRWVLNQRRRWCRSCPRHPGRASVAYASQNSFPFHTSSTSKLNVTNLRIITVVAKAFWDIGHAPKDQSNRRKVDAGSIAIGYAIHRSRSHHGVISVYDATGNVIETHEHAGESKDW